MQSESQTARYGNHSGGGLPTSKEPVPTSSEKIEKADAMTAPMPRYRRLRTALGSSPSALAMGPQKPGGRVRQ